MLLVDSLSVRSRRSRRPRFDVSQGSVLFDTTNLPACRRSEEATDAFATTAPTETGTQCLSLLLRSTPGMLVSCLDNGLVSDSTNCAGVGYPTARCRRYGQAMRCRLRVENVRGRDQRRQIAQAQLRSISHPQVNLRTRNAGAAARYRSAQGLHDVAGAATSRMHARQRGRSASDLAHVTLTFANV